MAVPWLMLGGAGLGFLEGLKEEQEAQKQRELAAVAAMYSPWTGINPTGLIPQKTSKMSKLLGGLMGGAQLQQAIDPSAMSSMFSQQSPAQAQVDYEQGYVPGQYSSQAMPKLKLPSIYGGSSWM